jgi:hypothetical protein
MINIKPLTRNFCIKILFCNHYFSLLNNFMRNRKDPDPDPVLVTKISGCRSERPKNIGMRIQNAAFKQCFCSGYGPDPHCFGSPETRRNEMFPFFTASNP